MVNQFLTLEYAGTEFEATQIRNLLREHGIESTVEGASSAMAMSHLGLACSVRVAVRASDWGRATEILRVERENIPLHPAWICPRCGEEVDAGFETCWSCGGERTDDAQPAVTLPTFPKGSSTIPDLDTARLRSVQNVGPYEPPSTVESRRSVTQECAIDDETEANIVRAWRATWLGFGWAPVIMHVYSVMLLLGVALSGRHVSAEKWRLWWAAMAVNLIVLVPCLTFLILVLR